MLESSTLADPTLGDGDVPMSEPKESDHTLAVEQRDNTRAPQPKVDLQAREKVLSL